MDARIRSRSLSDRQARVVLAAEAERRAEITLDEIQRQEGISRTYARRIAHDLVRKGWLQPTRRGRYLLNPSDRGADALPDTDPYPIGARLVEPYYFGYATAAELHGLLPQASQVYFLGTPARSGARHRGVFEFRFVHVPNDRFFGFEPLARPAGAILVSDRERTLLDCLDRPELAGGPGGLAQIVSSAKPGLDLDRLQRYIRRFRSRSLGQRLGYLLEVVRPSKQVPSRWLERLRPGLHDAFVPLGPPSAFGRRGPRNARWRIIENVPAAQLFAEVDHR